MSDLIRSKFELDLKAKPRKKAKQQGEGVQAQPLEKRPIFLALQGGGARGIVHVGALTARVDGGLEKAGVITERNNATTESSFFIGKLKRFRKGEVYARLLVYRRRTTGCEGARD
jgi:hypothetical protein